MDDMDDCDGEYTQDFMDTVEENSNLLTVLENLGSVESFLFRSKRVYARSIEMDKSSLDTFLQFDTDIDGCVVELSDVSGINIPIRKLTFFSQGTCNLKQLKPVLKKHLDLRVFNKNEFLMFSHCVGFQLFYEYGWEGWIGLIPRHTRSQSVRLKEDVIKNKSFEIFKGLKYRVQMAFAALVQRQEALNTLSKNDVNDIGKMSILPDDQSTLLHALQSVTDAFSDPEFELITFCFRFGEKTSFGVSLECFRKDSVKSVTVHSAVNVSSIGDIDLLWSASGLSRVVGTRGTLRTCLSFSDCANYQSNIDGRLIDVGVELRNVCKQPDRLRFVQLYADVPHVMPSTRFHPVSGVIAGGLCFPKNTADAFERDACKYISRMKSNLVCTMKASCRLEIVSELDVIPDVVTADQCLNLDRVERLLFEFPLLVPFPREVVLCVRKIGLWASEELSKLLNEYQKTGNIDATWKSFQLELALDKLLWGRLLCLRSRIFSVNLGPGVESPSRSLTDNCGYLALEPYTTCMYTEDCIPSTAIWTASEKVGAMIKRSSGLHDTLNGPIFVIGRRLIESLLKDLHEVGGMASYCRFGFFLSELKRPSITFPVNGIVTMERLVGILSDKRRVSPPMVYDRLCEMLSKRGLNVRDAVEAGLKVLKLTYFPNLEIYDVHRNAVLKWSRCRNFWKISGVGIGPEQAIESARMMSAIVKGELERRGLIYVSKLKNCPVPFPWIEPCLRKLAAEQLTDEQRVVVLAFLSCIGFIMQGWFVEYEAFCDLFKDLAIGQHRLKDLEIQSKLGVPFFMKVTVYRLHWTIPIKLAFKEEKISSNTYATEQPSTSKEPEHFSIIDQLPERPSNRITEDFEVNDVQEIITRVSSCLPVEKVKTTTQRWSAAELEILDGLLANQYGQTPLEMFQHYQDQCTDIGIPFRTRYSFEHKVRRLH